ncbi:hypothetical protein [Fundidesulfovibrio terrae]|uniref:hypothetical protein n=1 Tax=Fundidesulfovibrio terrae TaxID=2922866 RepID=UPI001FAEFF8C|nr:hypothetical protein [Fundidesulfovibrio terrae]
MLTDYSQSLERLQKALGENYQHSPYILGTPGTSLACKVDPFYYLAIQPGFLKYLSRWAGMLPERVQATLVKTGNMLSDASHSLVTAKLHVFEEGRSSLAEVTASFILAGFIDQALVLYGGRQEPPSVSRLKILDSDRSRTDVLFEGKTPLAALAFGNPNQRKS